MKSNLILFLLLFGLAPLSQGQTMKFADLAPTYTGAPLWPRVMLGGLPRTASFKCRQLDPAATPTAFSNLPLPLGLSYQSLGFSANQTSALGNLVQLAGTARVADHAEVIMVTWATAANYPDLAASDPSGYRHPVTATIYQLQTSSGGIKTLLQLDQSTVEVQIPWRPTTLPDGKPYPYKGYAFAAIIPFSANVTLPNECIISISFNTEKSGDSPLGVAGPYGELNLALGTVAPKVGTDVDSDAVFWKKNGQWYYPASNWSPYSPMLGLRTRAVPLPQPALTSTSPLHVGTYHIEATVSPEGAVAGAVMTVSKQPVNLQTAGLTKSIKDPDPFITVTNSSPGLVAAITYAGSTTPPATPGLYPFSINVTDSNHSGSLTGTFHLTGQTYEQWRQQELPGSGAGNADPDGDGVPNWLEYAIGAPPLKAQPSLHLEAAPGGRKVWFRQRREMTGVRISLESSADLSKWRPLETTRESSDDWWETLSTRDPLPDGFLRLKAEVE
jgi:hypothetical protein